MDSTGWVVIIGAVFLGIGQVVQMVLGYLRDKDKIEKLEALKDNLETNTEITKQGTSAATVNAKAAVEVAATTKSAVDSISKKLNGGVDDAINNAVAPLRKALDDHAASDERNMKEVKDKFDQLTEYIHQRNHDVLDALNNQSLKIDLALLQKAGRQEGGK